jgi:hypothetical protein
MTRSGPGREHEQIEANFQSGQAFAPAGQTARGGDQAPALIGRDGVSCRLEVPAPLDLDDRQGPARRARRSISPWGVLSRKARMR